MKGINFKPLATAIRYQFDFEYALCEGFRLLCMQCKHPVMYEDTYPTVETPKCRQCILEEA